MKLPQLHLRDLFWLILVSAFAVGWWRERQRPDGTFWKSLAEFCIDALEREGDEIRFDENTGEKAFIIVVPHALAGDWAKQHPNLDVPFLPTEDKNPK